MIILLKLLKHLKESLSGLIAMENRVSSKYFMYSEFKKECTLLTDYDNKSTGFVNDWDGGIDFGQPDS